MVSRRGIAMVAVGSGMALPVSAIPPMLCELVKNKELESKAVDAVCSKQSKIPASECEAVLSKVWEAVVARECPADIVVPPALCKFVKADLEKKMVDEVCSEHPKVPASVCEELLTKLVDKLVAKVCPTAHPDRLAQIREIENTAGVLWQAAVHDRFASEAPGASKTLNGVKGDWGKEIDAAVERGEVQRFAGQLLGTQDIPESFDSEVAWPHCAKIIGDIRDQSNCGCCWAFAGAEAASDRMCIATNASLMMPLSAQDVCFCSSDDGCGGGQIGTPWSYIKSEGAVSGGQYQGTGPFGKGMCSDFSLPHCHHHGPQGSDPFPAEGKPGCESQSSPSCPRTCDADAAAPHNSFKGDKYTFSGSTVTAGGFFGGGVKGIQKLIMAGGPVETAFTVYSDFENYAGGIYHHVSGGAAGGHAVKIVGWGVENDVQYWKVANSWNPFWGEKGYFRIKHGEGGIDSHVIGSSPDAKWAKNGNEVVV